MAELLEFDELQMYFGEDYIVNDYIKIHPPTVGEVLQFGEKRYYSMIHAITCIPSDMKSTLWDIGIDYEELDDFELFVMMCRSLTVESTSIIFGDFDFSKLIPQLNEENQQIYLVNPENGNIIDKLAYLKIANYLRAYHKITPKIEKAATKTTKKILIELDRQRIQKSQEEGYKSQLLPLISAMMRFPGFKYKSCELKECTLYEFMDTVQGANIYISSTALLQGSYSGFCDTSKVNKKLFDWMRTESL